MIERADPWDVVIVGYGPAGVACANLLGARGIRTLVLEREPNVFPRQRAISIDDEALRIIRNMGLFGEVTSRMHLGVTIEFTGLDGRPFMRLLPLRTEACAEAQANFFHQPYLEEALRVGVTRFPSVEVKVGFAVTSVQDLGDVVRVAAMETDSDRTIEVRARYVLACDGGSSSIRKQLGISFAGSSYDEQWLDVQAKVKRPFASTPHFRFTCDPARPGVDCPCPGGFHRWEWRINEGEDAADMQRTERLWELLLARGVTPDDVEIYRTWEYTFHVRCAERWRRGRVFLVGDAAHVMPPFAGQGISGAFRDAANLCWKVAEVLRGAADEGLLDTYEIERRKHHDEMTKAAVRVGRLVMPPNRGVAKLRDVVLGTLTRSSAAARIISRQAIRPLPLRGGYLSQPADRRSAVGRLIPLRDVFGDDGERISLDEALGPGFAVLGLDCDPRTRLMPQARASWEATEARFLSIRSGTSEVAEHELGDATGQLWNWFRRHRAEVAVIRPDRYVYAAGAGKTIPHAALFGRRTADRESVVR